MGLWAGSEARQIPEVTKGSRTDRLMGNGHCANFEQNDGFTYQGDATGEVMKAHPRPILRTISGKSLLPVPGPC